MRSRRSSSRAVVRKLGGRGALGIPIGTHERPRSVNAGRGVRLRFTATWTRTPRLDEAYSVGTRGSRALGEPDKYAVGSARGAHASDQLPLHAVSGRLASLGDTGRVRCCRFLHLPRRRCRGRLAASTTTDATEILFTYIKGALAARRTRDRCTERMAAAVSSRPSAARLYR